MYYATGSIMTMVLGIVFLIIIVGLLISCIKIVPQAQAMVIERLGAYKTTWGVGFHVKVPIIEKVARKVDLKEQVVDFAPQPVITKDNVTMQIDTVVFYQITDPKLFCYGVANPIMAIENLTATTRMTARRLRLKTQAQRSSLTERRCCRERCFFSPTMREKDRLSDCRAA